MFKQILKLSIGVALILSQEISAQEKPLHAVKSNGTLVYSKPTKSVENFKDMFKEGQFYGRLRNNNFYFNWANEDSSHSTHLVNAVGASLVYKTAKYKGLNFNLGLYGSKSFFNDSSVPVANLKAAKDTLSRYNYDRTGSTSMAVVGEANINYSGFKAIDITLGRQLFESFYTKSNDTKMIPNTFDGLSTVIKSIPKHKIKLAYLHKQKLRDHTTSHSVLMYDDSDSANRSNWNANDDSAMHKGLSYTALSAASKSTDSPLIVAEVTNKSIKNLKVDISSYYVPELLAQVMSEVNYKIEMDGFSITPGLRYIKQFDHGAGAVGGASLSGLSRTAGYSNPNSLNAQMIAARVVAKMKQYKINLAYTNILDEADLVTPWRGFPTAGYTRSMGIYNWRANTKSYRLELVKNANKTGVYKNMFIQTSVLYIDGDESKDKGKDFVYYYAGFIQNVPSYEELQWRLRLGYADFIDSDDAKFNYLDSRFELNYLF